jgi:hypothetical protein
MEHQSGNIETEDSDLTRLAAAYRPSPSFSPRRSVPVVIFIPKGFIGD